MIRAGLPVCVPQSPLLLSPVLNLAPVCFLDAQRGEEWPANQPDSLSHSAALGVEDGGFPLHATASRGVGRGLLPST